MTWQQVADLEQDVRALENDYFMEEESEEQARDRMSPAEVEADDAFLAGQHQKRASVHLQGQPWRKRRQWTGRVGRCRREGR